MAIIAGTLSRIKSNPLHCLGGSQRVNEHFASAGHVWRQRVLDPATTLSLFILQVLHGNTAITHLRHLSKVTVAASSYCAARARLPLEALAQLVELVCCDGIRSIQGAISGPALWLGALDLASGMILHLTMMSLGSHEMSQLAGMHGALRSGDVLLADRGFCSFAHLALLSLFPVDAVFRMHQRQIVDFTPHRPHRGNAGKKRRRGMPTSRYVRKLGAEDHIVQWVKPTQRPRWMDAAIYAALPATVLVRELRYRITTRGMRTRVVTVATTLLNEMRYPKRRIAELYGLRWEVETNFRHLKQSMGMEKLKCKSPDGIARELIIFVLVYNLVRAAMTQAAQRQGVADINRVSFMDALRRLRCLVETELGWLPGDSAVDLIVNPIRPERYHPRVKKRRMKEYDLMNRPRRDYPEPSELQTVTA